MKNNQDDNDDVDIFYQYKRTELSIEKSDNEEFHDF